jgi:hypothetical protein
MAMNFFDSKKIKYEVYSADDPKIFSEMKKGIQLQERYLKYL